MPTTLPSRTDQINQDYIDTLRDIQAEATDQILRGTPLLALLKASGCMKTQIGGKFITRTVRYDKGTPAPVEKGDVIESTERELDTEASFRFKWIADAVQGSTYTDAENAGIYENRDYINQQLEAVLDGFPQYMEQQLLADFVSVETGKAPQGLNDMVPPVANRTTGTYGNLARPTAYTSDVPTAGNIWWSPKYYNATGLTKATYMESVFRTAFNTTGDNIVPPDMLLLTQTDYEIFEEVVGDRYQKVVKDSREGDIGFEYLMFKGKPAVWSQYMTANNSLLLHRPSIDIVYDPNYFLAMGEWTTERGTERRQSSILARYNVLSNQLRRHCRVYGWTG